jgi:hypothetical protein
MGIKDTIKNLIKKSKPVTLNPTTEQTKIYKYWGTCIERARKAQPRKKWESAENRFAGKGKDEVGEPERPFVNDTRKQHEASMSFLDQQDASFKITPAESWMSDVNALKQAECDAAYIKRVWVEQKCQKAESRKLNDATLLNNGTTLVEFDVKKWMPNLRYLQQENVLIDPDCGGIRERANWEGYEEDVSVEEFRSWHKDISETIIKTVIEKSGSVLTDEERSDMSAEDVPMYRSVKVVHIYARNSAAIRKEEKQETNEANLPKVPLAEELQLDTPKRYMQYVKGWPALMVDEPYWPFDLDHDEFPTTHLQFNQLNNDTYGFTDHQQMERLDLLGDDIMRDLGIASFWAAVQKFTGPTNAQNDEINIENFLNSPDAAYLPGMISPDGSKPTIMPLERGQINGAHMQLYELVANQVKEASTLAETLANADAQTYKDVAAISARIADANMHQRINRRLGGPWGYEQSIAEDAIKMLEIAHQNVPQYSEVAMMTPVPTGEKDDIGELILDGEGQPLTEEQEQVVSLPWEQAKQALAGGGDLIKLGVDAIVGPELAAFWQYQQPPEQWKLNIKVIVEPGTTRAVTRQQQAASMKQLYLEMFQPFYGLIMQYNPVMGMNFMRDFLEFVGRWAQVPNIENKLPEVTQLQEMVQQWMGPPKRPITEKNSQCNKERNYGRRFYVLLGQAQ